MATNQAHSMVVAGKTFTLAGMLNSSMLELQLGNVFHILQLQAHDVENNKGQIELVKQRFSEIDDLQRKVSTLQAASELSNQRLNALEVLQQQEKENSEKLALRIVELEKQAKKTELLEKRMIEQDKHLAQVQVDFEQLRSDARDALTLASTVSFFKTELMELQEDVTKVLHQAPHTERLMHQVQTQLEKSTEQLQSVIAKTAVMEGALGKIGITVDEFKVLRVDLINRVNSLENPRVDRMGSVESIAKSLQKQVQVLQQNWMSNWGAHEQSMMLLRQDIMLHVDQLRNKCDSMISTGNVKVAEGSSLTFVRMDEEERALFQKTLDQHAREIARIDTSKADAQLVLRELADRATHDALNEKMDKVHFEERLSSLQNLVYAYMPDPHARPTTAEGIPIPAQPHNNTHVRHGDALVRPSTAPDMAVHQHRPSSTDVPSSRATASASQTAPTQQRATFADGDATATMFKEQTEEQQRAFASLRSASPTKTRRPQSTPPVVSSNSPVIPSGPSIQQQQSAPNVGARQSAAPSDSPANLLMAQRRIIIARNNKTHPALRRPPPLSISPSTNWGLTPGKIRPATAQAMKPGGAVYATDMNATRKASGDATFMAPLPSLDGSRGNEDFGDVTSWRSTSNTAGTQHHEL